ncbi:multiple epidermal growth factor-like domains protein 10 [Chiloscyllium plagiosum]|uniref:multiple epidermal growth factor-like domains protein 10 n=1 Tax=Chiloscyllium plagiosum TaxID=36176 RepID=UPI001CB86DD6|nr:multiple epidermal growth factor-like domains protein 10 [Chiloscyllium plagiosum]
MNEERDHVGVGHLETNATLPADWKHSPKHKDFGACGMDRSYSYSNSLAKYYNTGGPPQGADGETGQGPQLPPGHYASPKNSHIPVHYDLPPVRHYPPSPPLPRQHR